MICVNPQCGKKISKREAKLNAELCDDCLQGELGKIARKLQERKQ